MHNPRTNEKGSVYPAKRVWLNSLNRYLIQSGRLKRLIERNRITGVLADAPIFAASIADGREYQDRIRRLAQACRDSEEIYQSIVLEETKSAADLLMPVFQMTGGRDGFAGIAVSPEFAYDVEALIEEGQKLWEKADRPNIMIQIPATSEALSAIRSLLQEGINVNATLLYSPSRYREVAQTYVDAMTDRTEEGKSVEGIASSATFSAHPQFNPAAAKALPGGAIDLLWHMSASAALSLKKIHRDIFQDKGFLHLAAEGAQAQMLMWTDETDPAQKIDEFGCAFDLLDAPTVFDTGSISENDSGDADVLLDLLQEEAVKSQVVRVDAALKAIQEQHSNQLR